MLLYVDPDDRSSTKRRWRDAKRCTCFETIHDSWLGSIHPRAEPRIPNPLKIYTVLCTARMCGGDSLDHSIVATAAHLLLTRDFYSARDALDSRSFSPFCSFRNLLSTTNRRLRHLICHACLLRPHHHHHCLDLRRSTQSGRLHK